MVDALSPLSDDRFITLGDANVIHLTKRGQTGTCVATSDAISREDPYVAVTFPVVTGAPEALAYVMVSIGGVDHFIDVLKRVDRSNIEPLHELDDSEHDISLMPVEESAVVSTYLCPVCMEPCETDEMALRWTQRDKRDEGYLHIECTDQLAVIMSRTWNHTASILTDNL